MFLQKYLQKEHMNNSLNLWQTKKSNQMLAYLAPGGVFCHGSQLGVDSLDVVLHLAGGLVSQLAEARESGAQLLLHLEGFKKCGFRKQKNKHCAFFRFRMKEG